MMNEYIQVIFRDLPYHNEEYKILFHKISDIPKNISSAFISTIQNTQNKIIHITYALEGIHSTRDYNIINAIQPLILYDNPTEWNKEIKELSLNYDDYDDYDTKEFEALEKTRGAQLLKFLDSTYSTSNYHNSNIIFDGKIRLIIIYTLKYCDA